MNTLLFIEILLKNKNINVNGIIKIISKIKFQEFPVFKRFFNLKFEFENKVYKYRNLKIEYSEKNILKIKNNNIEMTINSDINNNLLKIMIYKNKKLFSEYEVDCEKEHLIRQAKYYFTQIEEKVIWKIIKPFTEDNNLLFFFEENEYSTSSELFNKKKYSHSFFIKNEVYNTLAKNENYLDIKDFSTKVKFEEFMKENDLKYEDINEKYLKLFDLNFL